MKHAFADYHPTVSAAYFALVLLFCMTLRHPVSQAISLLCAFAYAVQLDGRRAVLFGLKYSLPMLLLAALCNPAFSHAGQTILTYLPTGNPLTLESILYGLSAGEMLATALLWFMCLNAVMTTDKLVYLFGRIAPAFSLLLSMALRFVPRFRRQLSVIADAQRCVGRDVSVGSLFVRAKRAVAVVSILITWALENAIDTADSMKSRGYGLRGRTAFSLYRFTPRDKEMLAWLLFCGGYVLCGSLCNGLAFRYDPRVRCAVWTPLTVSFQLVYFALCITPVLCGRKERSTWNALH